MSWSNEWEIMHLTPGGWTRGTSKSDNEPREDIPAPADTLISVQYTDYRGGISDLPSDTKWVPELIFIHEKLSPLDIMILISRYPLSGGFVGMPEKINVERYIRSRYSLPRL
ncbi:hypothetical protein GW952_19115 [Klebsiella michiganensis]|uniref:Uncharacterized protein n=1 Tax=Klebsiella michiganensis TaxID=1134687 RepID=A0A6P1V145_9ENTR|nr:hypothetical protein [Klebsiella michiganensis]QHS47567.1 hypothetical protein GW952_19115 [Klebsiella michiganensis]HDX8940780.1 hypothetical protein [Klebsiella michiganensis]